MPDAKYSQIRFGHDGKAVIIQIKTDDGLFVVRLETIEEFRGVLRNLLSAGASVWKEIAHSAGIL